MVRHLYDISIYTHPVPSLATSLDQPSNFTFSARHHSQNSASRNTTRPATTLAVVMSEEQFVKSCERASSYPQNGLPTRTFRFALNAYSVKFAKEQLEIFHQEKRNMVIWDLVDDSKGMTRPGSEVSLLFYFKEE